MSNKTRKRLQKCLRKKHSIHLLTLLHLPVGAKITTEEKNTFLEESLILDRSDKFRSMNVKIWVKVKYEKDQTSVTTAQMWILALDFIINK